MDDALDAALAALPASHAERVRALLARASRQAKRVQLLQQIGSALARTLDEEEISRELVRGVQRTLRCDGIVVARIDLDRGMVDVVRHVVGETERPPRRFPIGRGALAEAARTGAPVLVAPYDASTSPLAAADDVVNGGAPVATMNRVAPERVLGRAMPADATVRIPPSGAWVGVTPEAGAGAAAPPVAGAVLAVPMMHGHRLLGVVALHDTRVNAFENDAREVLTTLAVHAASALSNARLFAESERERRQSEAMAEIARAVGESPRMGDVLRLILRHAMALIQAEGACIALRHDDYLHVVSALGIAELLPGVHVPVAGSLSGRVVTDGTALVANDAAREYDTYCQSHRIVPVQKAVIVPLVTVRGIIGVISVYNRTADFSTADARVLQRLADQVAVAIVNARLFEEVQDATREWSAAFESIGVGMALVDDEGRITRFNSRALQLATQDPPRTLIGRPFYAAVLGTTPDSDSDPLARAIRDGALGRTICEGSSGRWIDITAVPHPNGGAIVTFDDVSAQRAVAERSRLIIDASSNALFTSDLSGVVSFANPAAWALLEREDLVGTHLADLVLPEMAEEVRAHIQLAAAGSTEQTEYVMVRGDGERRVVTASLAPLREREEITAIVVSMHDVTGDQRARDAVAGRQERVR